MNLLATISIYAGGPGSGCHGTNCGRPISAKTYRWMRKQLKESGIKIPRNASPWDVVKTFDAHNKAKALRNATKLITKTLTQKHKSRLAKAMQKGKFGKKIGTTTPGIVKKAGKEHIDVKPAWKGVVKTQYTTTQGHQVTELKTPKQYEKRGNQDWVRKPDRYKGKYLVDVAEQKQYDDPKVRTKFFIHMESPDKGRSLEILRNLGEKKVTVIQRDVDSQFTIVNHKQVEFKNIGRASGWMNKKYGITFRLT
jgi:hypothetical protein